MSMQWTPLHPRRVRGYARPTIAAAHQTRAPTVDRALISINCL